MLDLLVHAGIVSVILFLGFFLLMLSDHDGRSKFRQETVGLLGSLFMIVLFCTGLIVAVSNMATAIQDQFHAESSIIDVVEQPSDWDFLDD